MFPHWGHSPLSIWLHPLTCPSVLTLINLWTSALSKLYKLCPNYMNAIQTPVSKLWTDQLSTNNPHLEWSLKGSYHCWTSRRHLNHFRTKQSCGTAGFTTGPEDCLTVLLHPRIWLISSHTSSHKDDRINLSSDKTCNKSIWLQVLITEFRCFKQTRCHRCIKSSHLAMHSSFWNHLWYKMGHSEETSGFKLGYWMIIRMIRWRLYKETFHTNIIRKGKHLRTAATDLRIKRWHEITGVCDQ